MSGTTWTKFFWSDWESDPALRLCTFAAQGLWMRMLCIAAAHDPIGYVAVAGRGLDETALARMTGGSESEVRDLLGELDRNGVFSRDRHGRIYSRRMVSDARRAAIARKNGKAGGNPTLRKGGGKSSSVNPEDKSPLKPQEPEAMSQKVEEDADASSVGSVDRLKPWERDEAFNALWQAATDQGRTRAKSKAKLWPEWVAARRARPDVDFAAAMRAYRAKDPDVQRTGGPGLHIWLRDGKFEHWALAPPTERPQPPPFDGPPEVWSAVVAAKGEPFAISYLTRCRFRDGALTTSSATTFDRLRREVGRELDEMGIRLLQGAAA